MIITQRSTDIPMRTIGLDLGDRTSRVCELDFAGEIAQEGRLRTSPDDFEEAFKNRPPCRIAIETGTHSPWVDELLRSFGHEVVVANPRKTRLITANERKSDKLDARMLARLLRLDVNLLYPVQHRSRQFRSDRTVLRSRRLFVAMRTKLINHVRGVLKSFGLRAPVCSAPSFAKFAAPLILKDLRPALSPILEEMASLNRRICAFDRQLIKMARERYPETQRLLQVHGVGTITALAFVLTIEDPWRFSSNRDVGAYLGMTPRRSQSGDHDPELRIAKTGDSMLRSLLIQAAHYIRGPFGGDCDLRRHGEKIKDRGGKWAGKRANVAVGRKLAILLLSLWKSGSTYEPDRKTEAA
jgi:transposase